MIRNSLAIPQNIKVLDFGLAKIKSTESFASLIQAKTTSLLGSPQFMSPEQWANEDVDARADIYSIGIILFQMLTGKVPFSGDSIPTIMYQHLQAEVPSFTSYGIEGFHQVELVIKKALAKERDNRYETAEQLLDEYKDAVAKLDRNEAITCY